MCLQSLRKFIFSSVFSMSSLCSFCHLTICYSFVYYCHQSVPFCFSSFHFSSVYLSVQCCFFTAVIYLFHVVILILIFEIHIFHVVFSLIIQFFYVVVVLFIVLLHAVNFRFMFVILLVLVCFVSGLFCYHPGSYTIYTSCYD